MHMEIYAYGDLCNLIDKGQIILVSCKVVSIKIHINNGTDNYDNLCHLCIIDKSIELANNINYNKCYILAITINDNCNEGKPTSYSTKLDTSIFYNKLLFLVYVGNYKSSDTGEIYALEHDLAYIENPSQSWNCLNVGAYIEKIIIKQGLYDEYVPFYNQGDI